MRAMNPHMRTFARLAGVTLLSCTLCPTAALGQIDSLDQFAEFSQTYYSEPRPHLVPAALAFLNTSPLVSNPDRAPFVTMSLSCILHRPELKDRSWDAELAKLHEVAALTVWAREALPRKNQLSSADALAVEAAFAEELTRLADAMPVHAQKDQRVEDRPGERNGRELAPTKPAQQAVIVLSKPSRDRDRVHD